MMFRLYCLVVLSSLLYHQQQVNSLSRREAICAGLIRSYVTNKSNSDFGIDIKEINASSKSNSLFPYSTLTQSASEREAGDAVLYGETSPTLLPSSVECSLLGENNFGDIMGSNPTPGSGGRETSVLSVADGSGDLSQFSPMERVVLTANGNLQRIMSAHYGAKVVVEVIRSERVGTMEGGRGPGVGFGPGLFEREVNLRVNGRKFCNARGHIEVHSAECLHAVESKAVGVGQLFRYLRTLPSFQLLSVGTSDRAGDGVVVDLNEGGVFRSAVDCNNRLPPGLRRKYSLECPQVRCLFEEQFHPLFLEADFATASIADEDESEYWPTK